MIKLYNNIKQTSSSNVIDTKGLLCLIKEEQKTKESTELILTKHKSGIETDFQNIPKTPYQNDKVNLLKAVTASTSDNRAGGVSALSNGFLCVDIDENSKDELESFRELVRKGKVPFIHLFARSVSGAISGAAFGLIKTDMLDHLEEIQELIGCTSHQLHKEAHALFVEYIEKVLRNDFGINIGKNSKSHKQARYVAHDSEAYFKDDSKVIEWRKVKRYYETVKEAKAIKKYEKRKRFESEAVQIAGDWQKLVHVYSEEKRGDDGYRMKAFYWGLKACLLGVSKEDSINGFIEQTNENDSGYLEQIEYVYSNYKDSFGTQSHLLEKEQEETWELPAGEYLSHFGDKIKEQLNQHKKISLIANTGLGKNYMSNKVLADSFNGVTVMVLSLNGKTEKDAIAYNAPNYFTGAKIQEIRESGRDVNSYFRAMLSERKIFVNANQCPKLLNMLHEIGEDVQLIVDEIQNVGREYRSSTYDELVTCFEHPCINRVLCMTGTPISGLSLQGFKVVRIKSQKSKILVDVKKRYKCAVDNIVEELELINERSIKELKDIKLLVRWNSKAEINEAKEYLVSQKILKEEEIVLVYSGQPQTERDMYIDRLNNADSNGESFAPEVRLILATNAIVEGIDIYTQGEIVSIDIHNKSSIDIGMFVQFLDRWRTKKVKKAVLYLPTLGKDLGLAKFNPFAQVLDLKRSMEDEIEGLYKILEVRPDFDKDIAIKGIKLTEEVANLIRWDNYLDKYVINFASLVSYVYSEFNRRANILSAALFISKHYPYIKLNMGTFNADAEMINNIISEIRDEVKTQKDEMINEIIIENMEQQKNDIEKAIIERIKDDLTLVDKLLKANPSEMVEIAKVKNKWEWAFSDPVLFRAMKDYFLCRANMRELGFGDEELHKVAATDKTIFSKNRVRDFIKGYLFHDMMERAKTDNIGAKEQLQAIKINQILENIEIGKEYTGKQLLKVVKDTIGRGRLPFNITAKNVTEMLNICLVGESVRAGRGAMLKTKYLAMETMEGYLQRYGLEMPVKNEDKTDLDFDAETPF